MSAEAVSLLPLREPDALQQRAPGIAVLVPCYNEAESITTVIRDFRQALPTARIYVYVYAGVAANIAMPTVRDILIVCHVRKRLDFVAAISAAGVLGFTR